MTGERQIRQAWGADNRPLDIYQGWCASAQRFGWILRPFGGNEIYFGKNIAEAVQVASRMREAEEEEQGGSS